MNRKPNVYAYTSILQDCISKQALGPGKNAHHQIIQSGLNADVVIGSSLVDMYAKCGSLVEAINVFDRLPSKTIVTWGTMMSAYVQNGQGLSALKLFDNMKVLGVHPDKIIYVSMLKACGSIKGFNQGLFTHTTLIKYGFESDVIIGSALVDMYAKCGDVESSRNAFDSMPTQNIVSWNTIISSYVQHGDGSSALALYRKMRLGGLKPNKFVMSSILKACALLGDYTLGKQIHEEIGHLELKSDDVLGNSLVDMYAKLGRLDEAHEVFATLPLPNLVSWGALITGYVQHGCSGKAIELYIEMHQKGMEPNLVIMSCISQACSSSGCLQSGRLVHDQIIQSVAGQDDLVACSLVDMYAKCGGLIDGCKLLDTVPKNVAAWGAMMSGCIEHGEPVLAIKLFRKFLQHGTEPNKVLCLCIVRACGLIRACDQGMLVHCMMVTMGLGGDDVAGSSLVDMYLKCWMPDDARKIFGQLQHQDVVMWGAMIVGHVQQGYDLFALQLFEYMQRAGMKPSAIIFPSLVKACGNLGALMQGQLIHDLIIRSGLKEDTAIHNSIIEMYRNCGCSRDERRGCNKRFTSPSNAASGKNMEFRQCTKDTVERALLPNAEHLNEMIHKLGCAGSLAEARHLLQTMPVLPDDIGWTTLLTSCRAYGDTDLGRQCYDQAVGVV